MLNPSVPRNTKKSKATQDALHSFWDRVLRQPELLFMQFIGREKEWKRGEEMAHKKVVLGWCLIWNFTSGKVESQKAQFCPLGVEKWVCFINNMSFHLNKK